MSDTQSYPGTAAHQALLYQIVARYRDDPRVLALTLFGSLARGSWDELSDLDLDVVIEDGVPIDPVAEVQALCASFTSIGERALLIVPDKDDAADVVLASMRELSIRYHPLAATSPNIVESVRMLSGRISIDTIKAAGHANLRPRSGAAADPLDRFARLALAVDRELQRRHVWIALALLDQMRTLLIEMFARAHGGGRAYNVFQASASVALRDQLGATLVQPKLVSAQTALLRVFEIVEQRRVQQELGIADGLSRAQRAIIAEIRQRQARLRFDAHDSPRS